MKNPLILECEIWDQYDEIQAMKVSFDSIDNPESYYDAHLSEPLRITPSALRDDLAASIFLSGKLHKVYDHLNKEIK